MIFLPRADFFMCDEWFFFVAYVLRYAESRTAFAYYFLASHLPLAQSSVHFCDELLVAEKFGRNRS